MQKYLYNVRVYVVECNLNVYIFYYTGRESQTCGKGVGRIEICMSHI